MGGGEGGGKSFWGWSWVDGLGATCGWGFDFGIWEL